MTFRGTAPHSTSKATISPKLSSAIICRVPDIEARRASMGLMGRTPTQQHYARSKAGRASSDKSTMNANIEGSR
jgi:hypothetical protein